MDTSSKNLKQRSPTGQKISAVNCFIKFIFRREISQSSKKKREKKTTGQMT